MRTRSARATAASRWTRRHFVSLLGVVAALPLAAACQQAATPAPKTETKPEKLRSQPRASPPKRRSRLLLRPPAQPTTAPARPSLPKPRSQPRPPAGAQAPAAPGERYADLLALQDSASIRSTSTGRIASWCGGSRRASPPRSSRSGRATTASASPPPSSRRRCRTSWSLATSGPQLLQPRGLIARRQRRVPEDRRRAEVGAGREGRLDLAGRQAVHDSDRHVREPADRPGRPAQRGRPYAAAEDLGRPARVLGEGSAPATDLRPRAGAEQHVRFEPLHRHVPGVRPADRRRSGQEGDVRQPSEGGRRGHPAHRRRVQQRRRSSRRAC